MILLGNALKLDAYGRKRTGTDAGGGRSKTGQAFSNPGNFPAAFDVKLCWGEIRILSGKIMVGTCENLQETVEKMLSLWRTLEEVFNARLTLHDHIGIFMLPDGGKLLPDVNVHRSPCCAFWYGARDRCSSHCRFWAAQKAAEEKKPFVSTCFCGVTELVMPLFMGKVHAATIFAGMYQLKDFDLSAFPQRYRLLYHQMPLWEEKNLLHLETLLTSSGYAMMMLAENLRACCTTEQGRKGQIRKFFRTHYAENVGVSDLAAELGLSESRTIHILLAEFQKGFSQLLVEERLLHVDELLRESKLPLRKIAEMTGFSNEYYLNSVFKKHYGLPPGAQRRLLKSQS